MRVKDPVVHVDHSYACIHTGQLGHTNSESAQHFRLGKTSTFLVLLMDGVRTWVADVIEPQV